MRATFGIKRELDNTLSVTEYVNGNGDFHFHSQIEVCIVIEGELEALVNNQKKRLKKGDISVALSYDTHVYLPVNYSKFTVLIIPLGLCDAFVRSVKSQKITNPFITNPEITEKIHGYVDEIRKESEATLTAIGYVHLILGLITKNVPFEGGITDGDTEISSKLLMYIHENFASGIALASVADHFGYTPSYISHYFKTCFGIGITQYINILKLNNAVLLLKENKHSITYCALESGFNSIRTFYRTFSTEFGCSPHEYMKMSGL